MVASGVFAGPDEQRLEFIRGEVREMSPIGDDHAYVLDLLSEWSFENRPKATILVRVQAPIRIPALESSPEPDLVWYDRSAAGSHPHPNDIRLLIEVAESSLAYDRVEKAQLYAEASIKDYWVVDCIGRTIEVFRGPTATGYAPSQTYRDREEIRPLEFPDAMLTPAMIFAK
jgi:Uma2 family endonuclease